MLVFPVALLLVGLLPSLARGATHNFVDLRDNGPTDFGPASIFPATIGVSGVAGTVTKVTVTTLAMDFSRADDLDMLLVGPNGAQVMLMSDACGKAGAENFDLTFDDDAPTFLSDNGPCAKNLRGSFKPSNYFADKDGIEEEDDFPPFGGPPPPYTNSLSAFKGISPNGDWKLFVLDDEEGLPEFNLPGWMLTLEVEPPPAPPAPAPVIVVVPGPAPAPVTPAPTGQRAKALAKCKTKPTKQAKKKCRNKAKALPL
jgi:subtilisin-like proprotein convertase family protein